MKAWMQKIMIGKYGGDQLSIAMMILAIAVIFISAPFDNGIGQIISILLLVICYFRMFSKNIRKRTGENQIFLRYWTPVTLWFGKKKSRFADRKVYRFYTCPKCKKTIRVPKGKGKISITCPICKEEFIKTT